MLYFEIRFLTSELHWGFILDSWFWIAHLLSLPFTFSVSYYALIWPSAFFPFLSFHNCSTMLPLNFVFDYEVTVIHMPFIPLSLGLAFILAPWYSLHSSVPPYLGLSVSHYSKSLLFIFFTSDWQINKTIVKNEIAWNKKDAVEQRKLQVNQEAILWQTISV